VTDLPAKEDVGGASAMTGMVREKIGWVKGET
jgi:hypothetical protein